MSDYAWGFVDDNWTNWLWLAAAGLYGWVVGGTSWMDHVDTWLKAVPPIILAAAALVRAMTADHKVRQGYRGRNGKDTPPTTPDPDAIPED